MGSRAKSPSPHIEPSEEHVPSEQELAEIEAAWEEEVLRIAKEHEEGRAESIPWEQVRAELFGKRN